MKHKIILLLVLALLLVGVADAYSNDIGYASNKTEAIQYIKKVMPELELISYSEMDDGHMFEGYLNGSPVTVYWMESQNGEIEIHHKPR